MRRALVVEDDPDIVELLTHYLKGDGWSVAAAGDGRTALDRLRREAFELLVLDIQMPGVDGLAVCAAVRAEPRTQALPVVMLTARGDETDRILGLEMADDYREASQPWRSRAGSAAHPTNRASAARPASVLEFREFG